MKVQTKDAPFLQLTTRLQARDVANTITEPTILDCSRVGALSLSAYDELKHRLGDRVTLVNLHPGFEFGLGVASMVLKMGIDFTMVISDTEVKYEELDKLENVFSKWFQEGLTRKVE